MLNTINYLKNLRISMASKDDTIMHVAAVMSKDMNYFLCGWGE